MYRAFNFHVEKLELNVSWLTIDFRGKNVGRVTLIQGWDGIQSPIAIILYVIFNGWTGSHPRKT